MIMIDLLVLFIDEKEITRMPQNIVQKLKKKFKCQYLKEIV